MKVVLLMLHLLPDMFLIKMSQLTQRLNLFTRFNRWFVLAICLFSTFANAQSDGFVAGVMPSRFELETKSGKTIRKSFKIFNYGSSPSKYNIKTVEWTYSADGEIAFWDELAENSCRPWVSIERREVTVTPDPNNPRNFRFEINIPERASRSECRFAFMVEGQDNETLTKFGGGSLTIPVSGQVAIIVYLSIDGAEPNIALNQIAVDNFENDTLPFIEVTNNGDAHGRLEAELWAKDNNGKKIQLSFGKPPVLANQTRKLVLKPVESIEEILYPLTVSGNIYTNSKTYKIDKTLDKRPVN